MHRYKVWHGMENGHLLGQGLEIESRGPMTAIKTMFKGSHFAKVSQIDVFGQSLRSLQYSIGINLYRPNFNWVQLKELDTGVDYFFKQVQ